MGIVVDDVRTPDDNWVTNKTGFPVIVAYHEMRGNFTISLKPEETKRITYDVDACAYSAEGEHPDDDTKYEIGKKQKWEVRKVGFFARLFKEKKGNLIIKVAE